MNCIKRVILKSYFGLPLDKEKKDFFFCSKDEKMKEFTEWEIQEWLYLNNKTNKRPEELRNERYNRFYLFAGRMSGKTSFLFDLIFQIKEKKNILYSCHSSIIDKYCLSEFKKKIHYEDFLVFEEQDGFSFLKLNELKDYWKKKRMVVFISNFNKVNGIDFDLFIHDEGMFAHSYKDDDLKKDNLIYVSSIDSLSSNLKMIKDSVKSVMYEDDVLLYHGMNTSLMRQQRDVYCNDMLEWTGELFLNG